MKNILVTGSDGQLGTSLRELSRQFSQFMFSWMDIVDLDLTDEQQVCSYFEDHPFDYIINCAAFTAVDLAEIQPEKAFAVNAAVPARLGALCKNGSARMIHISTDYIYNGHHNTPHTEEDLPMPLSVYAQSKLEGERSLWENENAIVLRTSWLYAEFGNNFFRTMLRLSKEKKELGVVFDQVGTPTYAGDLAQVIMHIIVDAEKNGFKSGIYNYSNEGVCSWFDFATEIMHLTGSKCRIIPIRTHEYPTPAKRPVFSVMDKNKIKRTFDLKIPYWRDSLKIAIANLEKSNSIQ
jgi:dTDP-4-dehydrorhamnose reductase